MRIRRPLSTALLFALISGLALGQEAGKNPAAEPASADPHLLWKFDTGG